MELTALIGTETGTKGIYALDPRNAFVEFVPADADAHAEAVFAPQTEVGKRYSLLISTYSGLYRYRLNDVIRVERMKNATPYFSYDHDSSLTARLKGAAITERAVSNSVIALRDQTGLFIGDFAYLLNRDHDGLVILLETDRDDISNINPVQAAELIEKSLETDEAYRNAVARHDIKPVRVAFMEQETQLFYRDVLMFRLNFPPDFIKPVRFIDNPVTERFFNSRIIKQGGQTYAND